MEHKIITNRIKDAKKYWITFVSVLLAAAFVIAIAALVFNRQKKYWLSSSNGVGREALYPFVFSSEGNLFVVKEDKAVYPIDNDCENSVFDAEFERVYYTSDGQLFEYDINKNSRKMLCEGVERFWIFEERTDILTLSTEGEIGRFSYNSKKTKSVRESGDVLLGEETNVLLPDPVCGKQMFVYADKGSDEGSVSLKYGTLDGANGTISENLNILKPFYVWTGDSAVSYYEDEKLCIFNTKNEEVKSFENAEIVAPTINTPAEGVTNIAKIYDGCQSVRYIVKDGVLCYVTVSRQGINVSEVDGNFFDVVAFDEANDVIVYRVAEEEIFGIYVSHKGGKGRKVLSANDVTRYMYEPDAGHLYYVDGKNNLFFVDVNDIQLVAFPVCENCDALSDYDRKPFAVALSIDGKTKTMVLNENDIRTYGSNEYRFYGLSDGKYVMMKDTNKLGTVSLDIVDGEQITRISSECLPFAAFDKKLEGIIYKNQEELFLFENGKSISLGKFKGEIEQVPVLAKKK